MAKRSPTPDQHPLIAKAVLEVGRQVDLASMIGVSQQQISKLLNRETKVTAEIAVAIERATNGQISREALRPDLFDRPSAVANHSEVSPQ